jgi:hypothetical protein
MNKQISTGVGIAIVAIAAVIIGAIVWFNREPQAQSTSTANENSLKGKVRNDNVSKIQAIRGV